MAEFKTHKFVAALPSELEADALYFVRAGSGFDLYVTNHSGTIVAYPVNNGVDLSNYAPKNNPAFTGITSVPTVATADNSTKIANTEFVNNFIYDIVAPQLYETFATHALLSEVADATEQALGGKQDALGYIPADAATVYTKTQVDLSLANKADLVGGKVPTAQLPDPPTVPAFATKEEVWAGTVADKIVPPSVLKAALEFQALALASNVATMNCHAGINFTVPQLTTNATLANPTNKVDGRDGKIDFSYDASARTLSVGSDWKKWAASPAIPTAANSKFTIVYSIKGADVFYSVLVKP